MLTLADSQMAWFTILTIVFTLVALSMILVILVQRPQGGGLAGAFGGAGGGGADTVFGGRVGDVLTWTTSIIFALFVLVAIGLNLLDNVGAGAAGGPPGIASTDTGTDESGGGADDGTTDGTGAGDTTGAGGETSGDGETPGSTPPGSAGGGSSGSGTSDGGTSGTGDGS